MRLSRFPAAVVALTTQAVAQQHLARYCPSSDVCYRLNIPEQTAQSGSGDIYFQLSGPTSYSWIGLGQGSSMSGANIFVMYADGNGNVTVSPRLGTGNVEPKHDTTTNVTLLEGSGVNGNRMIANVKCSNCDSWNGGSMDFSSNNGGWIHASRQGSPLNSADPSEGIEEHQDHGSFTWQFASAKGGADANPFIAANENPVSSAPASASSSSAASDSSSGSSDDGDDASAPQILVNVHAALAGIAFIALLPGGAIFVRLSRLPGTIWIHAGIQVLGYVVFVAAAGLGIYIASTQNQLIDAHPIIGLVLLGLLFTQPFAGLLHHYMYKKKHTRTIISYEHIWVGRANVLLGMINGGLGLQLAQATRAAYIAYGVLAGLVGVIYIAVIIIGERRRSQINASKREAGREKPDEDTVGE